MTLESSKAVYCCVNLLALVHPCRSWTLTGDGDGGVCSRRQCGVGSLSLRRVPSRLRSSSNTTTAHSQTPLRFDVYRAASAASEDNKTPEIRDSTSDTTDNPRQCPALVPTTPAGRAQPRAHARQHHCGPRRGRPFASPRSEAQTAGATRSRSTPLSPPSPSSRTRSPILRPT